MHNWKLKISCDLRGHTGYCLQSIDYFTFTLF